MTSTDDCALIVVEGFWDFARSLAEDPRDILGSFLKLSNDGKVLDELLYLKWFALDLAVYSVAADGSTHAAIMDSALAEFRRRAKESGSDAEPILGEIQIRLPLYAAAINESDDERQLLLLGRTFAHLVRGEEDAALEDLAVINFVATRNSTTPLLSVVLQK